MCIVVCRRNLVPLWSSSITKNVNNVIFVNSNTTKSFLYFIGVINRVKWGHWYQSRHILIIKNNCINHPTLIEWGIVKYKMYTCPVTIPIEETKIMSANLILVMNCMSYFFAILTGTGTHYSIFYCIYMLNHYQLIFWLIVFLSYIVVFRLWHTGVTPFSIFEISLT